MDTQISAVLLICFAAIVVGTFDIGFQLFQIASLDAKARGFRHPKLLGFLAMGGDHSSGLLMYFILRRKHPVLNMSKEASKEIESRKKRAGAGIFFLALGAIGFVITLSFL